MACHIHFTPKVDTHTMLSIAYQMAQSSATNGWVCFDSNSKEFESGFEESGNNFTAKFPIRRFGTDLDRFPEVKKHQHRMVWLQVTKAGKAKFATAQEANRFVEFRLEVIQMNYGAILLKSPAAWSPGMATLARIFTSPAYWVDLHGKKVYNREMAEDTELSEDETMMVMKVMDGIFEEAREMPLLRQQMITVLSNFFQVMIPEERQSQLMAEAKAVKKSQHPEQYYVGEDETESFNDMSTAQLRFKIIELGLGACTDREEMVIKLEMAVEAESLGAAPKAEPDSEETLEAEPGTIPFLKVERPETGSSSSSGPVGTMAKSKARGMIRNGFYSGPNHYL
jgi:hypothetical protein